MLAHCAQEPIEFLGNVQPFGGLLVLSLADGVVRRYSAGAQRLLGGVDLPGRHIDSLVFLQTSSWVQLLNHPPGEPIRLRAQSHRLFPLDALVHLEPGGQHLLVELLPTFEDAQVAREEAALFATVSSAIETLRHTTTLDRFWTISSELLRDVLGYERVMIYRFEPDASGTVIAEATQPGVPVRFLNLRFPESDIPAQARALYVKNLVRVIADVSAVPDPLIGGGDGPPVDQSLCLLRQPSAMHVQYLRNMGVRATLTVSLLHQGQLWGMLACHHGSPRVPPHHLHRGLMVACQLLGTAFNTRLDLFLKLSKVEADKDFETALPMLMEQVEHSTTESECLELITAAYRRHLPLDVCDPSPSCAQRCTRSTGLPDIQRDTASVCIPMGEGSPPLCLRLRKAAEVSQFRWGGDPAEHEAVTVAGGESVLGPRRSFEAWLEAPESTRQPWTTEDRERLRKLSDTVARACLARLANLQTSSLNVLGAALDQASDLVIVTLASKSAASGQREIVYVNQALLRHTGYTAQEVMGHSPSMFQGPDTNPVAVARMSAQLAVFQPVNETLINYRKNGTAYQTELSISPLTNAHGQVTHFLSVQRDVTRQRELIDALQTKNEFMSRLTESLPAAIFMFRRDAKGRYHFDFATSQFYNYFGFPSSTPTAEGVMKAVHPDDFQTVVDGIERVAITGSEWRQRFRVIRPSDGIQRTLEGRSSPVAPLGGDPCWFGLLLDVTEQEEMEQALNEAMLEHESTLAAVPEKLLELEEDGTLLRAHMRGPTLLGIPVAEVLGQRVAEVYKGAVARVFQQAIAEATEKGVSSRHELAFAQGSDKQYRSLIVVRKDRHAIGSQPGARSTYVASLSDITSAKHAEKRIRFLVEHDELTHLLNRRGFQERLHRAHAIAQDEGHAYALVFVDLDHFKHLNDSHGHRAGDAALKEVAARIRGVVSVGDVLARLGGDEYVVLLTRADAARARSEAIELAHKVHKAILRPLELEEGQFSLTCSVGIALADPTASDSDEILRWADLAMYSVKVDGRNGIRFFSEDVHQQMLRRIRMEQELRQALPHQELMVYGQPIVDIQRGMLGYECLLRWFRGGEEWVSPADFIPIAEQSGQIVLIGHWVLEQACKTLRRWAGDPTLRGCYLAVNVSSAQIKQPDFVQSVARLMQQHDVRPGFLKLEMTESLLQENIDDTIAKMEELRAMGVKLSLDDFGTGYSSLSYLLKLPIDELKMDRSFLLNSLDQPKSATLARMIVQTAQSLGLDVIAEGVETDAQQQFLVGLGCRVFQGYKFGRPAPMR